MNLIEAGRELFNGGRCFFLLRSPFTIARRLQTFAASHFMTKIQPGVACRIIDCNLEIFALASLIQVAIISVLIEAIHV